VSPHKDLGSPGAQFITDPNGTIIVGAPEVLGGNATHVSGVQVKGLYKLVIHLVRPDGAFLLKLTMPFFQASSTKLPLTHEVTGGYPSAGPAQRRKRADVHPSEPVLRARAWADAAASPFWSRRPLESE
jgi:hypothetical protein